MKSQRSALKCEGIWNSKFLILREVSCLVADSKGALPATNS